MYKIQTPTHHLQTLLNPLDRAQHSAMWETRANRGFINTIRCKHTLHNQIHIKVLSDDQSQPPISGLKNEPSGMKTKFISVCFNVWLHHSDEVPAAAHYLSGCWMCGCCCCVYSQHHQIHVFIKCAVYEPPAICIKYLLHKSYKI